MKGITELREMTTEDLKVREKELKETLFRLTFRKNLGDAESGQKIARERKTLARVKTLIRARELGVESI
jgi:large subunit ribosomal protein L29